MSKKGIYGVFIVGAVITTGLLAVTYVADCNGERHRQRYNQGGSIERIVEPEMAKMYQTEAPKIYCEI